MKDITVRLSGWADSLTGTGSMKFPVIMAIHEVKGDTDWEVEVKATPVKESFVYDPYQIDVVAKRIYSCYYHEGKKETESWEILKFTFITPQLAQVPIYEEAVKKLKTIEVIKEDVKVSHENN